MLVYGKEVLEYSNGDLVRISSPDKEVILVGIILEKCYFDEYSYKILYEGKTADFDLRFWNINPIDMNAGERT